MNRNQEILPVPAGLLAWAKAQQDKLFRNQEYLYHQGDEARQFYCLLKGRIQVFVTSPEGSEKTLAIYQGTGLLGEAAFFDGRPRTTSARALEPSRVVVIDRENILACFREQPDLALSMITSLSQNIRMLSTQINEMSFLPANKRLAAFLLQEAGKERTVSSYTHEEIGSRIGSTRVTVSRILHEFQEKGWIKTKYRKILICDPKALEAFYTAS